MTGYIHMDASKEGRIRTTVDLEHVSMEDKFQIVDACIKAVKMSEEEWMVFVVAKHQGIFEDKFGINIVEGEE